MTNRTILAIHPALRDDIGDLTTRRPVPGPRLDHLNPFLFLNHHGPQTYPPNNRGLPFGPHPHRGFETVTFILDGSLAHADTGGHQSIIEAGGIQWMTAGRGLVHAELSPETFLRQGGGMEILQLWVNLPARLKMTAPRYTGLQRDEIPAVAIAGGTLNLIAGDFDGQSGPVETLTGMFMSTISLKAGAATTLDAPAGRQVFLYVVRGEIEIAGTRIQHFNLVQLSDGDAITLTATQDSVLIFGHADPIDEPVVFGGPFVMNTEQEIRQAYADYRSGLFGRM